MKLLRITPLAVLYFCTSVSLHGQLPTCPGDPHRISIDRSTLPFSPPTPPPPTGPTDSADLRMIFFVHGLGGNPDAWVRAATATQSGAPNHPDWKKRLAICELPTYTEVSLLDAGSRLQNVLYGYRPLMQQLNINPERNFIIAHSQGGLVARKTDELVVTGQHVLTDRMFKGIVTFGTAHQGAQILNNSDDVGPNLVTRFAEDACNDLGAGPAVELSERKFLIDIFTNRNMVRQWVATACDLLGNVVVPLAFQDYTAGITNDYKVGAAELAALNSFDSDVHKVAFYGEEDDPVIWRTMNSLEIQPPVSFNFFEADPDTLLLRTKVDSAFLFYARKYINYDVQTKLLEDMGLPCDWDDWILNTQTCLAYDAWYWEAVAIRNAYRRGTDWFSFADARYKDIIGAWSKTDTVVLYCDCENTQSGTRTRTPISTPAACNPNPAPGVVCEVWEETVVNLVYEPNDGVVLRSSAASFPGAAVERLLGSNHQQMRNDSNTKFALNGLYDGTYGWFFITKKINYK